MRFSIFLALLVFTFVACTSSFASAENFAVFDEPEDSVSRRLRTEGGVNKDNVVKIAGGFIEKMNEKGTLLKAINMAKNTDGDEVAARKAIMLAAGAKEGSKLSDESMIKLSAQIAGTVQKNPISWPHLKKFAQITLGAGVGALAMYGVYKLMFDKSSSTAVTTTTTTTTSGSI